MDLGKEMGVRVFTEPLENEDKVHMYNEPYISIEETAFSVHVIAQMTTRGDTVRSRHILKGLPFRDQRLMRSRRNAAKSILSYYSVERSSQVFGQE